MTNYDTITRRGIIFGVPGALLGAEVLAQDGTKEYKKDFSTPKTTLETFLAAITAGDIKGTHGMFSDEKRRFYSGGGLPDDQREMYELAMLTSFASLRMNIGEVVLERIIAGSAVHRVIHAPLTSEESMEKFSGRRYRLPDGTSTALGEVGMWWDFNVRGEKKYRNSATAYLFLTQFGFGEQWRIETIDTLTNFIM